MHLQLTNLEHRFSRDSQATRPVLDIEELEANPGELLVLTGPSGSGKSTLLYVLSGLIKPTSGKVLWDGHNLAAQSETARDKWRRKNAGFVFQDFNLFGELTPRQNVVIAAYFGAWSAKDVTERAEKLLADLNIDIANRPTATCSRGEQQRIALARALIFDPPVLFADEPTASLDAENALHIAKDLQNLARNQGKTLIAVSHDPALISRADKVLRLDRGKITVPQVMDPAA